MSDLMNDHARGCEGREYTCTCGYDTQRDACIAALSAENERLRTALEWALDRATDSDHPHYPARGDRCAWVYPYLVSGPVGGGVGEAGFASALEAVEAAMVETRS